MYDTIHNRTLITHCFLIDYSSVYFYCILNDFFQMYGVPIKIETCRYGLNRVPVNERLCETCNLVEDEIHVLLHCSMYDDIRDTLFADICNIKRDFCDLTVDSQFILIMSDPLYFKFVSKAMYCILNRRRCAMLR